jgi:hypothetical protein
MVFTSHWLSQAGSQSTKCDERKSHKTGKSRGQMVNVRKAVLTCFVELRQPLYLSMTYHL